MNKSQMIKMMQQSGCGGTVFITKKGVAEAFGIKDDYDLMSCERLAINEACNLLEDLPQGKEANELRIADVGGGK